MTLEMKLLGIPEIWLNGRLLTPHLPAKAIALLAYLSLTRQPASREKLATLFWGNMLDTRARNNLSIVLTKLKQQGIGNYLVATRRQVSFTSENPHHIDVYQLEQINTQQPYQHRLSVAATYRGDFLADLHLGAEEGVELFNEWQRIQRARLQTLALILFHQVTIDAMHRKDLETALYYTSMQLTLEPWNEKAHRQKIRLLMRQGQREQAIAQYRLCVQQLEDELAISPAPETQVLYEQITQNQTAYTTAPSFSPPFQAPMRPPHFVGRQAITQQLTAVLTQTNTPRLALVGMGGIGKTAVATHLAYELRHHFHDGILWANAVEQDLPAILQQWGHAYGYDWSQLTNFNNLAAAFRDLLADKQVLIILDDLLQSDAVRAILPNTPYCALLITTRDHDVAYALDAQLHSIDVLANDNSLQLLHHIIGSTRLDAEQDSAQRICALLEHLPLAIEIVAQRLRSRPSQTLEQMVTALATVKSRLKALQLKDRAVRASFEVSWQLLNEPLQQLFAGLAIFNGRSFAKTAVVATLNPTDNNQLDTLVALSLLNHQAPHRYRQHTLLTDFALEKLANFPQQQQQATHNFIDHYYQFAQNHRTHYDTLRPDWPNIYAALHTAYQQQKWQQLADFTAALTPIWFTRARYNDALTIYPLTLEAGQHLNDPEIIATTLLYWAKAYNELDQYQLAKEKLLLAYDNFQQLNQPQFIAETMLELGRVEIEAAEYETAHQWLSDAQQLTTQLGDDATTAVALYRLARLHRRVGDFAAVEQYATEALALQGHSDYRITIRTHRLLAAIYMHNKAYQQAQQQCQLALTLAQQHKNKDEYATTLYTALSIAVRHQDHPLAYQLGQQSLTLFHQMGAKKLYALTLYELSISHWYQEQWDALFTRLEEGINILQKIKDNFNLVYLLGFKGNALHKSSQSKAACAVWQTAYALARPQHHPITQRLQTTLREHCPD